MVTQDLHMQKIKFHILNSYCCCCFCPTVREFLPNYEVEELQPSILTPLDPVSIAYCYSYSSSLPQLFFSCFLDRSLCSSLPPDLSPITLSFQPSTSLLSLFAPTSYLPLYRPVTERPSTWTALLLGINLFYAT